MTYIFTPLGVAVTFIHLECMRGTVILTLILTKFIYLNSKLKALLDL